MTKKEMVKVIRDPEQQKLFENPNFGRILFIMRKGELNIKEIHRLFNKDYEDKKTLTTIYRYMDTLQENDLVFVSREELKRGHLLERYYMRTAKFFLFQDEEHEKETADAAVDLLQRIYNLDEERKKKLKKLAMEYNQRMYERDMAFYEKYGEEILETEKKYGYKSLKGAAHFTLEILNYRKEPHLVEEIFSILEGDDKKS